MTSNPSFVLGYDEFQLKKGQETPFIWNQGELANGHVGITGTSGSGKTYQIRRFLSAYAADPDTQISIFDYHGDIDVLGATEVLFSESTRY
ncbi:DUF87 domain-containing protein, partial [Salmonella enterica]|nr:DUF87 domain-containing protein [Salmonella enterica]